MSTALAGTPSREPGGTLASMVPSRWRTATPAKAGDDAPSVSALARPRHPLLGYWVASSAGWRLAPLALAFALWLAIYGRGRAWAGDWVWGMTAAGSHVIFTSSAVAAVAAYDAGSAFAGPAAAAWDSVSRRGADVVRVWLGALAPFLLVHLTTVLVVVALLVGDGAAYGQTLAPLAQQLSILALGGAVGVLAGVVGGTRLGAFAAAVATTYVVYWRGYNLEDLVPARLTIFGTPRIGSKLSEPLVAVQVAGALVWIVVLLAVAATSRWGGDRRRPRLVLLAAGVGVLLTVGAAAEHASAGWRSTVATHVPRVCSTHQGVTACLYRGHDRRLGEVLDILAPARATAVRYGVGSVVPTRLTEVPQHEGTPGGFGEIFFGADDSSRSLSHRNLLDALVPGKECAALATASSSLAPFNQRAGRVRQTMDDLAKGRPPGRWHLPPDQLRTFVENARRCDIAAAAGPS